MDSTLYEDHVVGCTSQSLRAEKSVKQMKSQLTLDFKTASQQKSTPSLSCLAIDSPDFEKFIASQSEQFVSSSTPTTQILFPKLVTEEQEAYARGFIDALEELHKRQGTSGTVESTVARVDSAVAPVDSTVVSLAKIEPENSPASIVADSKIGISCMPQQIGSICNMTVPIGFGGGNGMQLFTVVGMPSVSQAHSFALAGGYVVTSSLPSTVNSPVVKSMNNQPTTVTCSASPMDRQFQMPVDIMALKSFAVRTSEGLKTCLAADMRRFPIVSIPSASTCLASTDEPQTVPCLDSSLPAGSSDVVVERKRARNRVAAQKCRMRKLERIEELSDRVREIRSENERLSQVSAELRKQIGDLKREILSHVSSGCRVMAGSSIQS